MADDLRKLALAATSGPWFAEAPPAAVSDYDACRSQYHAVVTRGCCIADDALPRDAAYIAAAHPQAVLGLLARIEQADTANAQFVKDWNLRAEQHKAEIERLEAALTTCVAEYAECFESMRDWASYAGDYFQKKHGLAQDIDRHTASLAAARALCNAP